MRRAAPLLACLAFACAQGELEFPDGGVEDALTSGFKPPPTAGFDAAPQPDRFVPPPPPPPPPNPDGGGPVPFDAAPPPPRDAAPFIPAPDMAALPPQDPGCPNFAFSPPQPIAIQAFDVAYITAERYERVLMALEGGEPGGNPRIENGRLAGENPYQYTWTVSGLPRGSWRFTFSAGEPPQQVGTCLKLVQ